MINGRTLRNCSQILSTRPPVSARLPVIPSTRESSPDAGESWKVGARITHSIGKLNFGLVTSGLQSPGYRHVFKVTSRLLGRFGACLGGQAPA